MQLLFHYKKAILTKIALNIVCGVVPLQKALVRVDQEPFLDDVGGRLTFERGFNRNFVLTFAAFVEN